VLNLFSYTGAFSVHAAKAGAVEVVAVDTASKAHARARRNFELSDLATARHETLTGDATKTLERFASRGRQFDVVVCDPPTFSHGPAGQFSVARDLAHLAGASAAVLAPGGFLVLASNSTKLSAADLDRALAEGAASVRAELRIVERVGLPPDFPVAPGFPEGNYLKLAIAIRVP
jgi:23S rRNA (cytosine1962-C5)-methyltransferase